MVSQKPTVQVSYDNVDISADVSNGLISFTYKDKVSGQTDDLDLCIEDSFGLWKNAWYPKKGATIVARMGYNGNLVECGKFQIDEIELSGPPSTINIRAIGIPITKNLKTKKSKANEGITLKQLAENVCKEQDLTLDDGTKTVKLKRPDTKEEQAAIKVLAQFAQRLGNEKSNTIRYQSISALQIESFKIIRKLIDKGYKEEATLLEADCKLVAANMTQENCFKFAKFAYEIEIRLINAKLEYNKTTSIGLNKIRIDRTSQNRESDLAYLSRISAEYGFAFSVKGDVMVYYNLKSLEDSPGVATIIPVLLKSYTLKDKVAGTVKSVNVSSHNPNTKETITATAENEEVTADNGDTYKETTSEDTLEVKSKAENQEQADAKAKAALHDANGNGQTGSLSLVGDPLLVAGNNFNLLGFGEFDGRWHILESTHSISKSGGYTTDIEIKRIARRTGNGSSGGGIGTKKRGDTKNEEDLLLKIAAYARKISKYDSFLRYSAIGAILRSTYPIVKSLYDKNCNKEAKDLQANCDLIISDKSRLSCVKFAGFCEKIRTELIKAKK